MAEDLVIRLSSNSYDPKERGVTIAKTYLQAGRRKVAPPVNIVLGSQIPELNDPPQAIALVQKQLPAERRQNILAISFLRQVNKIPEVRLGRIGALVVATLNHFTIPVVNPLSSHISSEGLATVRQRDPASSPEAPRHLRGSADLDPVIVLPVFSTVHDRHPITDAVEVGHSIYVGLHGPDMEQIVDKKILG